MGKAKVISGGPSGRYTIEIDTGEALRVKRIALFSEALVKATAKRDEANVRLIAADAKVADAATKVHLAISALVAAQAAATSADQWADEQWAYLEAAQTHRTFKGAAAIIRREVATYNLVIKLRNEDIARWNAVVAVTQKKAWCVDLTEDASGFVATADIPGESELMLIAPGGRKPTTGDGTFVSRELLTSEHAFFNAAILPGVQKYKPTYRWGTITSIERATDRCNLTLDDAKSSAQRLSVNQASTLENVPIQYMTCNSLAFEVGDRVVVQFVTWDWAQPRVIGFLDNPRSCGWACVGARQEGASGVAIFFATTDQEQIDTLLASTALNWSAKVSNGPSDFRPVDERNWPGHSVTMPDDVSDISFDYLNDTVTFTKFHAKNIAPGTNDSVTVGGLACRPGYIPGLTLPPEYVGVVLFRVSAYRFDAPSFIGDLPDEWAEVLVKVGTKVIFNVAARAANHPGMPITIDISGGNLPIVAELPVGRFPHTLYVETLP